MSGIARQAVSPIKTVRNLETFGWLELGRGKVISKEDIENSPGEYPVYSSAFTDDGFFGKYSEYLFSDERVSWSIDGGGMPFYRHKHRYSLTNVSGWMRVVNKSALNTRYLYYAVFNEWYRNSFDYALKAHPSVIRDLYAIPLPTLGIQQRIADYLDRETAEIDAAVADLDRYVELLEIRKKAKISHAVLGDAEPGQRQLLNGVIGTIPSSWAVSKFSIEFSESNELNGDDVAGSLLSISEFHGVILNRRGDEGQQSSEDVSHYRVVHPGQLAANMMWLDHGGLGVSALHGHISPDYRAFDISERISPAYAHYLLRSKTYVDHFSTISVGVRPNAKRTTKVTLGMTPIPIPPLEVQARIVADLDREATEINDLVVESKKLRDLLLKRRSVLITEVVTGRKQV